jgi:hypothetical protein
MLRKIGLLGILCLLMAAAPARLGDTYSIKIKRSGKESVTQHKREETEDSHIKLEGPDGDALNDKKESKTTIEEYKETILEKKKGKRATKIRRQYSKAVVKTNGKEQTLPHAGKTLLIEKKGDKYHFTIEGGEELKGKDAESLNRVFNKPNDDDSDNDELDKVFLPKKPVAVNDTWKIDPDELIKAMAKDPQQRLPVDKSKATGKGKLLRAYKKNGRQYGVFDIEVKLPLKGEFPLGKDTKAPIREGSATMHMKVDACIDGTSSDAVAEMSMTMDLVAGIKMPGSQDLKITLHIAEKGKDDETDLAKK